MTAVDDILSRIPLADLAARLGVDEAHRGAGHRRRLPALLGGIEANTDRPGRRRVVRPAVKPARPVLVEGGVNLDDVDEQDGQQIVRHVFGDNPARSSRSSTRRRRVHRPTSSASSCRSSRRS